MQRIKYGTEPVLHVHRYIVTVGCNRKATPHAKKATWHVKYHYCANRAEVRNLRKSLPKGRVVEVYEAHHNFREGWTT